ncbi:Peptidase family M28 [Gracilimonas mengyeensis]|uniref:Peptidase family M28 n=1 Tax=Gracilimonas mengyeensis TaxID=1302730 RepID=A0A521DUK7_9BACT|nr:Peptidase family M28 [Gracilimonas mengyeensis]
MARVIKTLSSDSLKGRHAFSPEIKEAAKIISSEFEKIGLSYLPGEDDFLQEFTIHTILPESTAVMLNGEIIEPKHYFGVLNGETIHWKTGDVQVEAISQDEDFRKEFRKLTDDEQSALVLISKNHKNWFHRYRNWFASRNRTFKLNQGPSDIFIFSNATANRFEIYFQNEVSATELANVIGVLEGKRKDEVVIFSGHYDHIGIAAPTGRDSIANGANDNASGVAAIIELARYYSQLPKQERSLYFTAFTAEENGGLGSKYFSERINPEEIIAMINMEMIGKPSSEGPNSAWITGFELSDLGSILQSSQTDSSFTFYPDPYPAQNLFYRSDNASLARLGVPAHTISTTPIDLDRDYHTVSDEFHTINIEHVSKTIDAIAKSCKPIIRGTKTPSRINPDSLR